MNESQNSFESIKTYLPNLTDFVKSFQKQLVEMSKQSIKLA